VSKDRRAAQKPAAGRGKKHTSNEVRLIPIPFAEEVRPCDALAEKLVQALRARGLALETADILVVKHKIVSKSEGRIVDLATITPSPESVA